VVNGSRTVCGTLVGMRGGPPKSPAALAAEKYFGRRHDVDPVGWSKTLSLGVDSWGNPERLELWSKQREICESVAKNRYTAVRSCHDGGKSFIASFLSCWFIESHPIGEAIVVTTAPTGPQVSAILWREIEKLHRKAQLRGRINMGNQPEWWFNKQMLGYGRKPADHDASGFQGIHDEHVLVIVDEAGGIPGQLWVAIDTLATNEGAHVLVIGNPDDANSHFNRVCQPGSGWNVIEIDGLRTPNFHEEAVREYPELYQFMVENGIPFSTEEVSDKLRRSLLSVQWVAERLHRWGVKREIRLNEAGEEYPEWKTTPLWESKVRGRFSVDSADWNVIPLGWVMQAQQRWLELGSPTEDEMPIPIAGRRVYACDVAREGDDETCVVTRQGHAVLGIERIGKQDTMTTAKKLMGRLLHPRSVAVVDVVGVGAGVVDRLREERRDVVAFSAAARTSFTDRSGEFRFPNVRSASWWKLREMLDPDAGATLALPPDDNLVADLTAPKWRLGSGATIIIEPKEETKKRLGRSPDTGDATVMSFWYGSGDLTVGGFDNFFAMPYGGDSPNAFEWHGGGWGDVLSDVGYEGR